MCTVRAHGSARLLWQYFDTHKAAICTPAQKGRLSNIFNKQQISACTKGEGRGGEARGGVRADILMFTCPSQCTLTRPVGQYV